MPSLSIQGIGTLQTAKATGTLQVDIADGEGQLVRRRRCTAAAVRQPTRIGFSVAVRTQPASFSLSADLNVRGELKLGVLDDLGLGGLLGGLLRQQARDRHRRAALGRHQRTPRRTRWPTCSIPPNDIAPRQTGTSVSSTRATLIPTATKVKIGGKTVPLGAALPLVNAIVSELTALDNHFFGKTMIPLIDNFNNALDRAGRADGRLRFGGADVYAVGAVCGRPSLAG